MSGWPWGLRRALAVAMMAAGVAGPFSAAAEAPDSPLSIDRVTVYKHDRRMVLEHDGRPVREYRVALGPEPVGAKERQGDGRTPEGSYCIDSRKQDSAFHKALHISYPSDADRRRAAEQGVHPGGAIFIHGLRSNLAHLSDIHHLFNWTRGCIALTNQEIDEVWNLVPDGTPIEILP